MVARVPGSRALEVPGSSLQSHPWTTRPALALGAGHLPEATSWPTFSGVPPDRPRTPTGGAASVVLRLQSPDAAAPRRIGPWRRSPRTRPLALRRDGRAAGTRLDREHAVAGSATCPHLPPSQPTLAVVAPLPVREEPVGLLVVIAVHDLAARSGCLPAPSPRRRRPDVAGRSSAHGCGVRRTCVASLVELPTRVRRRLLVDASRPRASRRSATWRPGCLEPIASPCG